MLKKGQVTIKDIARLLGVAPSTVSRALQGHPDISEEKKREINELAAKLRYKPNIVALSLKQGHSNTIGLIIPEIVHFFFSQVISGIEDVAHKAGYTVIICQSNEKYDREIDNCRTLIAHQVEGILVSISKETNDFQHFKEIQDNGIPLVFFDRIAPGIQADQVITDDMESAYLATIHLVEQGRKRIAHFAGPQNLAIGRDRKAGYLKALAEAGIPCNQEMCTEVDSFEKAFSQVAIMIRNGILPDAIFAANDLTAIGAMKSLKKEGIKIPEDVAVVGFSSGRFAEIADPLLTSVDQHGYEMGSLATHMLLSRIQNQGADFPCEIKVLKGDLIIRNSSCPP
jgi:DNA-binding LacI/PurR family transcriptional regulator